MSDSVLASDRAASAQSLTLKAMPWVFVLIWSTGFVVARLGLPYSPPFTLLCLRYGFSVLGLLILIVMGGLPWPRDRMQWLHLGVTGILIQASYLGGVWAAVKMGIGAGTVALIVGLQPVLTAVWVSAMSAKSGSAGGAPRVTPMQWLGLALGLAGLALVVWRKFGVGEITNANLACALFALAGITIGTLYQKRFVASGDARPALAIQMGAALIVTLPLALFETEPVVWHWHMIAALAWSVFILTMFGNSLLYLLIQRGAATSVTSLMYLVPPTTATMAWVMFDEPITTSMLLGMALTAVGVAVVLRGASR